MNIHHLRKGIPALAAAGLAVGLLAAPAGAATSSHAVKTAPVAAARSASSGNCVRHYFGYGSSGNCVADIQSILDLTGRWDAGYQGRWLSVDGGFGPLTYGQVRYFQWFMGLESDGVVGPATWRWLCVSANESNDISAYYNAGC